ncbi:MAG TPA: hypothetical protein DEQ02_00730 [Ruminococcaceae bacterium]|nr:hypothetical protein [Oscillospiraceae bacterium]
MEYLKSRTKKPERHQNGQAEKTRPSEVEYSYALVEKPAQGKNEKPAETNGRPQLRAIKGKKHRGKIRALITFAVILILMAALVYLNSLSPGGLVEFTENLYAGMNNGNGFPVRLPDEKIEQVYISGNDLVVLTDAALLEYNSSAYQMFYRQHGMSAPVVDTESSRILVYDRGGKALKIENRFKTVFEIELDNALLLGRLSESGGFAVATRSQRYSAEIKVFGGDGFKNLYTRYLVAGEITGLDISRDGRNIVYSVVEARGGEFVSTVYICDIKKKDPIAAQVYENAFVVAVDYKEADAVAVLGDSFFSYMDKMGGSRVDYNYDGRVLELADRTKKGFSALFLAGQTDGASGDLLIISADGTVTADFTAPRELRDIALTDDGIYGLYGRHLALFDHGGEQKGLWEVGQEVSGVTEIGGSAALLKNSEISVMVPGES